MMASTVADNVSKPAAPLSFNSSKNPLRLGITRRGYLPSSQPPDGYDVPTRVADDIAVLDALKPRPV
jgi:hypothetical protein